jgi:hypothetical protein
VSRKRLIVAASSSPTCHQELPMIWKLLGLQKLFDSLFDEAWVGPSFVCHGGFFCDDLLEAESEALT